MEGAWMDLLFGLDEQNQQRWLQKHDWRTVSEADLTEAQHCASTCCRYISSLLVQFDPGRQAEAEVPILPILLSLDRFCEQGGPLLGRMVYTNDVNRLNYCEPARPAVLQVIEMANAQNTPLMCFGKKAATLHEAAAKGLDELRQLMRERIYDWDGPQIRVEHLIGGKSSFSYVPQLRSGNTMTEAINDIHAATKEVCQWLGDYETRLTAECQHAIAWLRRERQPELTTEEARMKFCFEEWQAGRTHKEINAALKRHAVWEHFDQDVKVRGPINSWGKRIGVKPRRGQPGRRPKPK
jgi:hypothetical protein